MLASLKRLGVSPLWWVALSLLVLLAALYLLLPDFRAGLGRLYATVSSGDESAIQAWVATLGFWGPLSVLALMIAQTLLSAVPLVLIMVVAVLAYGPIWGGLLAWIGAIIAAVVGYSIARAVGPLTIDRFISEKLRQKIEEPVRRYGPWAIIALRLSPLVPTDSVNFVAGLVKMPLWQFLPATALGAAPIAAAVAWLGADFQRLGIGLVVITAISLGALGTYVLYDQLRQRRKLPR